MKLSEKKDSRGPLEVGKDSLARLSEIFCPLKANTSTPSKLYKLRNRILNSPLLEPYQFSIQSEHEVTGDRCLHQNRSFASQHEMYGHLDGSNRKKGILSTGPTANSPLQDTVEVLDVPVACKVEKFSSNIFCSAPLLEIVDDSVKLVIPEPISQNRNSTCITAFVHPPSDDISTNLPLACFGLAPPTTHSSSPIINSDRHEVSELPLAHLKRQSTKCPTNSKTKQVPKSISTQSIAILYKDLLLLCTPGPDPLDLLAKYRNRHII